MFSSPSLLTGGSVPLTIPISGRSSESPPSRGDGGGRGGSARQTPVRGGEVDQQLRHSASPISKDYSYDSPLLTEKAVDRAADRTGTVNPSSPFWSGVGARSRQYEYPERDVPAQPARPPGQPGGAARPTAVTVDPAQSLHVTNLLIDKSTGSCLNLPVPFGTRTKVRGFKI